MKHKAAKENGNLGLVKLSQPPQVLLYFED
jgi:hypothetical protein